MNWRSFDVWSSPRSAYVFAILGMVWLGALALFAGWPLQLAFIKALTFPLYVLATRALDLIFASEAARTPGTPRFYERNLLEAFVFSAFLAIYMYSPEHDVGDTLVPFAVSFVFWAAWRILSRYFSKRKTTRSDG